MAPGVAKHLSVRTVATISFKDLLDRYGVKWLDVLQIDAEGMDAQLLAWFPFERVKPALLHYETAHMTEEEHQLVCKRLQQLGYIIRKKSIDGRYGHIALSG